MIQTQIIFIIGVSGVGKSTIGSLLSSALQIPMFEGDDYHPEANIKKMASGTPLTDDDRLGWLQQLNKIAITQLKNKRSCVIVCSALKETYRTILNEGIGSYSRWFFLAGTYDLIQQRILNRKDHFMSASLLKSQFDTLEVPRKATPIDATLPPNRIVEIIKNTLAVNAEFGVLGLGVMGKNLSRNLAGKGVVVSLFNRHVDGKEENVAQNVLNESPELSFAGAFDDLEAFTQSLQLPRKIMLMVNAGKAVDAVINQLLPLLDKGDIILDGGNSNFNDSNERIKNLIPQGIALIPVGISGGEEGALRGPSIMPSGDKKIYQSVQPYLELIAAKDGQNNPCCTYLGGQGSGHFVKMVHNGIEYAEMQLLAEVVDLFNALGKNPDQIARVFDYWSEKSTSYLLEITSSILKKKDDQGWLVHNILDKAGNKGTGSWATITAAQLGTPSTMITTSLFARYISFFKNERIAANSSLASSDVEKLELNETDIYKAYQFARIINHYQGFRLLKEGSNTYHWDLNLSEIARIWTAGCIIRSDYMESLVSIFKTTDDLLLDKNTLENLNALKPFVKKVVSQGVLHELAIPTITESISFTNSFSKANSSANIIQAQRDFFGAHKFQKKNDTSGNFFHVDWKL